MMRMPWEHVKILDDKKTIYMRCLQDFGVGREGCLPSYWKFETDGVFYNNTQEEIYDAIMSEVLERVVDGSNAIILTYGQTGSGRSLTASGLLNSYKDRGIAPRLITDLFRKKEALKTQRRMCIQMSYIETKKMYINDLLNPTNEEFDMHMLKHIKVKKVKDEFAALKLLFTAEGRREFSNDLLYRHAANGVLTFRIVSQPLSHTDPVTKVSKIHVVDLAGVDTYGNITAIHKNIFEVGNANIAKSQLEQFVLVLCQNIPETVIVKQRLNILVQYLADSLNAQSILRCIGHIRTNKENLLITISMLRFGQVIRGLRPQKLQQNVMKEKEVKLEAVQEELKQLQIERDIEVMLRNHELATNITQERLKHMQNVAIEYLQNKTNELVILNVTDGNTVLKVFKDLYNKLEVEKNECMKFVYQKAYEDAVINVKTISSKTDSTSLSSRGSKKNFRKPRENGTNTSDGGSINKAQRRSIKGNGSRQSSTSATKILDGTKGRKSSGQSLSRTRSPDPNSTSRLLKRTKTSSSNAMRRSTGSKKKSVSSTATTGTDGIGLILEEIPLPDAVPSHDEAWNLYINEDDYQCIFNAATLNKENAQEAHRMYFDEIKNLQKCKELVDLRKYELQKSKMLRLFHNKEERDEDDNLIVNDLEKLCTINLDKAHEELLQQQEKTLKSQSEFCIALETYHVSKNIINEKFEQFCMEKFQTSVPNLQAVPDKLIDKSLEISLTNVKELETTTLSIQKSRSELYYESLKEILKDQIQRKIIQRSKAKGWIQSCRR